MTKFAVKNPVTILVLAALMLAAGALSYISLPRESFPEIKIPYVFVNTVYPGAAPQDIEKLVTEKIEDKLEGLDGVKKVTSQSMESISSIQVEFNTDVDVETALRRVKDKVDMAKGDLPDDAEDPMVQELNFSNIPIFIVSLTADYEMDRLEQVADALGTAVAVDDDYRIAVIGNRYDSESTLESGVAPDVELTGLDGERHRLFEEGHGKTLVVAFSSWCGCRYDLPGWKQLKDELADHDFGVVAVAIDESTADVAPWATDIDYPVLVDTDRTFADSYGLVNVPTVIWLDEERRVVRQPAAEFSDDQFTSVHGIESGPHLEAVRAWVREGVVPDADAPAPPPSLGAEQRQARAEFRLALELKRRGHDEAAADRVAIADALAPDDFTIWRAGMQLVGDDPFGAEFFDRYTDWQQRHGGPLAS